MIRASRRAGRPTAMPARTIAAQRKYMPTTSGTLKAIGGAALAASAFSAFSHLRYQRSATATFA